jgi:hypothetical protein
MVLGWQKSGDKWDVITPEFKEGKAALPTGTFRVVSMALAGKGPGKAEIRTQSSDMPNKTFEIAVGTPAALKHGLPLTLDITHTKSRDGAGEGSGAMGVLRGLFGGSSGGAKATVLQMNVEVKGAFGEVYSAFYNSQDGRVPPPRFLIADASGKQVATGNFEYG